MANSEFTQTIVEVLLSWMRLVTGWVWNFFQADMGGGFLSWFSGNWKHIAFALIIVGLVVDWLIWMIRWRPYWLWLRKRQIIYEEVETPGHKKRAPQPQQQQAARHMPRVQPETEFDDPFAAGEVDPYAAEEDKSAPSEEDDFDWDGGDDPYAAAADEAASPYARPTSKQKAQSHRALSSDRPR